MIKRLFDIIASLFGIIIFSPLLIVIAIFIKLDSPGKILFKQIRVGKNGQEFAIYKFRTMVENAEALGKQITVSGDQRITKIGQFLRKYKLDELPQLFNVFEGTMSVVGPRPEVPKYVNLYTLEQRKVLEVKPGITDLASLEFRNENEILATVENPEQVYIQEIMPQKLNLNMEYITKSNLWFDLSIIFQTIWRIVAD